jgi:hypothetical protein
MRKALLVGLALGAVAGLLFVFHDSLQLTVSWPVILGFALWHSAGRRGTRGLVTALAGAVGAVLGYATFAFVSEVMPLTTLSFGIAVGVAVAALVMAGTWLRERLPMAGLLIGYAAFLGVFEPRWAQSATSIRTHGISDLTIALLGLTIGILAATVVRAVADRVDEAEEEEGAYPERTPVSDDVAVEGGTR